MSEGRRNIQWMETRELNHARANLHGSARQLAWLDFATCMVQLAEVHGWTKKRLFQALRPSTLNPYMCIDFAIRFGFAENNSRKIAGCDTRTSHPAIAELRKVRHDNFAPCDSLMSHLATSRYRTLPLSSVAQCDSNSLFLAMICAVHAGEST